MHSLAASRCSESACAPVAPLPDAAVSWCTRRRSRASVRGSGEDPFGSPVTFPARCCSSLGPMTAAATLAFSCLPNRTKASHPVLRSINEGCAEAAGLLSNLTHEVVCHSLRLRSSSVVECESNEAEVAHGVLVLSTSRFVGRAKDTLRRRCAAMESCGTAH
jgi:hypothetical protein